MTIAKQLTDWWIQQKFYFFYKLILFFAKGWLGCFWNSTVRLLRSDWSIFLPRDFAAQEIVGAGSHGF
jgi:hypothetical protein